jgi:23S rRNA (uracil1939-C5)-methyltransferase
VQVTLLCGKKNGLTRDGLARMMQAAPQVVGVGAVLVDRVNRPVRTLAEVGAAGLGYRVGDEAYWVTRGGFFQVNRFLLETLVELVCAGRSGAVAWDLFAGVGLFSRVLARRFAAVTAVEANGVAVGDLRVSLAKMGAAHTAVEATTLGFLQGAVLQRERAELVVLDPPRAGAGAEACALLLRLRPEQMVYVSCDPGTLARDLAVLQEAYAMERVDVVDLFPQTVHVETVVGLRLR